MTDTLTTVRTAIADSIGIDLDEVTGEQTLFGDLELESIDLLDVFFRIEQGTGVSITADSLGEFLQGGIADDAFSDDAEVLTPTGLAHLETVIPGFDAASLSQPLHAEQILELVTVATLDRAVQAAYAPAA